MATTASENTCSLSSKTVLRLKRKRTEDPADILLVSHAFKKSFKEPDVCPESESNSVQRIFRLAGTVAKNDHSLSPDILNNLKSNQKHRSKLKTTPQANLTVESINEKLRETKKLSSQKSRYKVILKNRENEENSRFVFKSLPNSQSTENEETTKEIARLYEMYDAVLDEVKPKKKSDEKGLQVDEDPNAILCNSVKMIREKLIINDESSSDIEKDYVYDVYCAEDNYGELSEMLDIVHLNQCQLMPPELDDELEKYDDEDDSNDEDNWRNDYPDEEEWSQSSGDEPRYRSENFDYGWRDPDEYNRDHSRRMFSDDLSSDDEKDNACFGKEFSEYGHDSENYNFEVVDEDD